MTTTTTMLFNTFLINRTNHGLLRKIFSLYLIKKKFIELISVRDVIWLIEIELHNG
jgi:hypothetical protein